MFGFAVTTLVISHLAVLLVGWCVLPAPKWVTNLWRAAFHKEPLVPQSQVMPIGAPPSQAWGETPDKGYLYAEDPGTAPIPPLPPAATAKRKRPPKKKRSGRRS